MSWNKRVSIEEPGSGDTGSEGTQLYDESSSDDDSRPTSPAQSSAPSPPQLDLGVNCAILQRIINSESSANEKGKGKAGESSKRSSYSLQQHRQDGSSQGHARPGVTWTSSTNGQLSATPHSSTSGYDADRLESARRLAHRISQERRNAGVQQRQRHTKGGQPAYQSSNQHLEVPSQFQNGARSPIRHRSVSAQQATSEKQTGGNYLSPQSSNGSYQEVEARRPMSSNSSSSRRMRDAFTQTTFGHSNGFLKHLQNVTNPLLQKSIKTQRASRSRPETPAANNQERPDIPVVRISSHDSDGEDSTTKSANSSSRKKRESNKFTPHSGSAAKKPSILKKPFSGRSFSGAAQSPTNDSGDTGSSSGGIREMDRHASILSKENFDLKLRLHHTTQQLETLKHEMKRFSGLEGAFRSLKDAERQTKREAELLRIEVRSLQESCVREKENNKLLIEMLERRDEGLREAAEIICEMEEMMDEQAHRVAVEKEKKRYPRMDTSSYESDIWRDAMLNALESQSPPSVVHQIRTPRDASSEAAVKKNISVPLRTSSLNATEAGRSRLIANDTLDSLVDSDSDDEHADELAAAHNNEECDDRRLSGVMAPLSPNRGSYYGLSHGSARVPREDLERDYHANGLHVDHGRGKKFQPNNSLRRRLNNLLSSLQAAGLTKLRAENGSFRSSLSQSPSANDIGGSITLSIYRNSAHKQSSPTLSTGTERKSHYQAEGGYPLVHTDDEVDGTVIRQDDPSYLSLDAGTPESRYDTPTASSSRLHGTLDSPRLSSLSDYTTGDFGSSVSEAYRTSSVGQRQSSAEDTQQSGSPNKYDDHNDPAEIDIHGGRVSGSGGEHSQSKPVYQLPPYDAREASAAGNAAIFSSGRDGNPAKPKTSDDTDNSAELRSRRKLFRSLSARALRMKNRFVEQQGADQKSVEKLKEQSAHHHLVGSGCKGDSSSGWSKVDDLSSVPVPKQGNIPVGPGPYCAVQTATSGSRNIPTSTTTNFEKPAELLQQADSASLDLSRSDGLTTVSAIKDTTTLRQRASVITMDQFKAEGEESRDPCQLPPTPASMHTELNTRRFSEELDSKQNPESTPEPAEEKSKANELVPEDTPDSDSVQDGAIESEQASSRDSANRLSAKEEGVTNSTISDAGKEYSTTAAAGSEDDGEAEHNGALSGVGRAKKHSKTPARGGADTELKHFGSMTLSTGQASSRLPSPGRQPSDIVTATRPTRSRTSSGLMTTASVSPAPSSRLAEPGKPPNAPLLEQGEWPPSEFGSTEFNVDLESALEFEEWEARGRRMGKGGSYLPNSLPPYLDGLGLELPSPTFVPLSAGSTVTTVTGGAQTNNPRSRQGFRDRIMQPLRKKPQEPHTVRSVISPTFGYPSRSHDSSTALMVDGAPATGISTTRSHESRSRSSTQNARRLKHARTHSSRSIQQVQEYSSNGERQSATPPEERREKSAETMEIAPFAEPEDIPSEPAANTSSKVCVDDTPASVRKEQQSSRGNFNKSTSLGFGGHRSRISSSLFSWIRPSSRSRQEARNNIKALSCASRQPDEVGSPLTRISGSYFTTPIHATPPGESTSSPLPEQAPGEPTTTTSPSSTTAPFVSASELSTQKTPFAFTNGLSYSHGSENSSVSPAVALFGANPFGGVSTTIVGGADANKGSAGNTRPRGKLMRSMSFKAPHR